MVKKAILNRKQIAVIVSVLGMLGFVFLEGIVLKSTSIAVFVVGAVMLLSGD